MGSGRRGSATGTVKRRKKRRREGGRTWRREGRLRCGRRWLGQAQEEEEEEEEEGEEGEEEGFCFIHPRSRHDERGREVM